MSRLPSPISNVGRGDPAVKLPISPLVGEMSGRTEGGAKERKAGKLGKLICRSPALLRRARAEIDLGQVFKTQGISIVAHTPESTPRNFSISVSRDGREFREVSTETVNTAMRRTLRWSQRPGRYVRIDIRSDNGNLNVTLKGVYVHREEPLGAAVATARSMTINNMPGMAFSEAGWRAPAVGWLIFRRSAVPGGVQRARIAHAPSAQFTVKTGATLWRLLESRRHSTMTCTDNPCYVPIPRQSGDYVMLEWGGASADTRIVLDRHEPRPQLPGSFRAD